MRGMYGWGAGLSRIGQFTGPRAPKRAAPFLGTAKPLFVSPEPGGTPILMNPFLWLILTLIDLYIWILIASAILSWLVAFNVVNTRNQIVASIGEFLYRITEPALRPIRNILPNLGGIDISPVILIIGLLFLKQLAVWLYVQIF
jgi:YggT family protein